MEIEKINKAANILYNSRINLKRIKELPKDCILESLEEAYLIQDELTKKYLSADKKTRLIEKKLGVQTKQPKFN